MTDINWLLVGQVAGLGFLVLFIVVGSVAITVWLVGLIIRQIDKRRTAKG